MGLIQLHYSKDWTQEIPIDEVEQLYNDERKKVTQLMEKKNHDYGEAWRQLSQTSFVDLILTKLERMKQILANEGKTIVSEGLEGNFHDIINYALFALIKIRS